MNEYIHGKSEAPIVVVDVMASAFEICHSLMSEDMLANMGPDVRKHMAEGLGIHIREFTELQERLDESD